MKFELIIIGNELLNGKIKDKNINWLAKYCYDHHHELKNVQIVPDNYDEVKEAILKSKESADIIITTGGLGPTKDDKTKEFLSQIFNKPIEFNQEAFDITLSHYERGQREFDPEKILYHSIPKDFMALYNPNGYAPALGYEFSDKKFIFSAPGVPSEFQEIVSKSLAPFFKENTVFKKHIIFKTWKLPESLIFNKLCPDLWEELEKFGEVSSLPHLLGVDIGVVITNKEDEKKVLNYIKTTELNKYIWNIGPESIEEVIIKKAKEKKLKIGFAESCTGGLLASRITDIPGSSSIFWGSVISYSNEVKMGTLGVNEETLNKFGAVSLETAKEMAEGALSQLQVDIAVSTTGIAGPGGGSSEKPVGTVGIGFAMKKESSSELLNFKGNREDLKFRFSQAALFKLLELIDKY